MLELSRDSGSSQAWAAGEGGARVGLCGQTTSVLIGKQSTSGQPELTGEESPSSSPTTDVE